MYLTLTRKPSRYLTHTITCQTLVFSQILSIETFEKQYTQTATLLQMQLNGVVYGVMG